MSWFCNTPEAIEQMKICEENNCPDCEKCIWIQESANAMAEYGTVVKVEVNKQLDERIQEKKNFISKSNLKPKQFDSYEEKVTYIKQLFIKGE